ncbi:MAG: phosphoribosylformylglycinamidine synthase subunit PurL [Candidatus Coatesbacteria bacterium]|nr:phosphoribosylformylglycinamidine synthase subunit PurL [Candidatus Coatesbacteria bacterium]
MTTLSELLKEHNLTEQEYSRIVGGLGRAPNDVELGMFSVMWSEHCCYKSSKPYLKTLPTTGERVIQGPGENAGVLDLGDKIALVFKIESHNHPSFIEPFQGAATGVGGILRDIFTMGARPFAILDSLHFGDLGQPLNRYIMRGVVSGIASYGNCIGVPTVGGQTLFADCYAKNPLVNVMCAGLAAKDKVFYGKAQGPGNIVVYAGSSTGRDGLHGATMASAAFDEASQRRRPTVQVGDPFAEKLVMEACLELMDKALIVGIQDMGAAGLTCSTSEMAFRGRTGVRIDLAKVPRRAANLTAYEMMLSESQERMLLVVEPSREREVLDVFKRWGVKAASIGVVTNDGRLSIDQGAERAAEMPLALLVDGCPVHNRPLLKPAKREAHVAVELEGIDLKDAIDTIVASPNLCDKRWVFEQFDHLIGTNTVVLPGADAAVMRIKGTKKAVALCLDGNGAKTALDPYQGAIAAVAEAFLNVCCVGAEPLAVTNCLNFGNPESPEVMWQFAESVRGLKDACKFLGVPVTGGNVSFYNETLGESIYPTPVIGMIGLIEDVRAVMRHRFQQAQDVILLLGKNVPRLEGSELARLRAGAAGGQLLPFSRRSSASYNGEVGVDLSAHVRLSRALLELGRQGLLQSAHDCSEGGVAMSLLECCFGSSSGSSCGVRLRLPNEAEPVSWLFAEAPSRAVISVKTDNVARVTDYLNKKEVEHLVLGEVGQETVEINQGRTTLLRVESTLLRRKWAESLENVLTGGVS